MMEDIHSRPTQSKQAMHVNTTQENAVTAQGVNFALGQTPDETTSLPSLHEHRNHFSSNDLPTFFTPTAPPPSRAFTAPSERTQPHPALRKRSKA